MPPAPLMIPYLGYASLLPSSVSSQRDKQRRRRRASLLLALLAACCCLFLRLLVAGRAGRGGQEEATRRLKEGGAEASAAATTTAAAASSSSSSPLTPLQRRLLLPQRPTHDLSADGSSGRVQRVAAARLLAVEAELLSRKKQRREAEEEEEEKESSSSSRQRRRRRRRRQRHQERGSNPLSLSSSPSSSPSLPRRPASDPGYVAACVVLRDQNDDLPEFVAWHAALGVGAFYLYDDRSALPVTAELARSLLPPEDPSSSSSASSRVFVHVTRLSEEDVQAHPSRRAQMAAYDDCALRRRAAHSWLAFLDVDEFVTLDDGGGGDDEAARTDGGAPNSNSKSLPPPHPLPSLPALLARFEAANAAALVLHWRVFGSSGRGARRPAALSTPEAYTSCLPAGERESAHVKTVARTALLDVAEPCLGPHHFSFWDLGAAVDELERERRVEEGEEEGGEEQEQEEEEEGAQEDEEAAAEAAAAAAEEGGGEQQQQQQQQRLQQRLQRLQREWGALPWASRTELVLSPSPPYPVDVRGRRLDGPVAAASSPTSSSSPSLPPPFSPAFLAHYAIKSREDYGKKMERGSAMGNRKTWEFFDGVDARAVEDREGEGGVDCLGAARLARRMREAGALVLPG